MKTQYPITDAVTAWSPSVDSFLAHSPWHNESPSTAQCTGHTPELRFPHGMLATLRHELLSDSTTEHFALAMGYRRLSPGGQEIIVVQEALFPAPEDIHSAALHHVRPTRGFIRDAMAHMQSQGYTALIDIHTHPFARTAHFSGVDTADEQGFCRFFFKNMPQDMAYASIVIAQEEQSARVWRLDLCGRSCQTALPIRTQTAAEVPTHKHSFKTHANDTHTMQARSALALGVETLRRMAKDELIVLAGVGGLGSVLAEQLVRSGFMRIGLIDDDVLELSNLNRFAGGYYADAMAQRPKVDVVEEHLKRITPHVDVVCVQQTVEHPEAEALMAAAQWILVSTDSHSSRHSVQKIAFAYGVPFISAGVNITVGEKDGRHHVEDQSGEVILVRYGEGHCLHCLGRIHSANLAAEAHPDKHVREELVRKGYVQGVNVNEADAKEPAVMPLNAVIASQAVHCLLTQYRQGAEHAPIVVYEAHTSAGGEMYVDTRSLEALPAHCYTCGRYVDDAAEKENTFAA